MEYTCTAFMLHLMSNTHRLCHASRNGFAMDIFRVTLLVHNLIWSEWNKHIRGNWTQLILKGANWFSVGLGMESSCAAWRHSQWWKPLSGGFLYQPAFTVGNGRNISSSKNCMNAPFLWWFYVLKERQSLKFVITFRCNDAAFILLLILAAASH